MTDFGDLGTYGLDPWAGITLNERNWFDPILREIYNRKSVYSQHATMQVDMNGPKARTITFNDLIPPRPNIAPIGNRDMDASRLYSDSWQRQVTTARYGNGMSFHRESNMFNYWEKNGAQAGLKYLIESSMGQVIVDHLDLLARNTFFSHPYPLFGVGAGTSFGDVTTSDKLSTTLVDEFWLMLHDTEKPFSSLPQSYADVDGVESLCITTAGAIYDLKTEVGTGAGGLNFVDVNKYTELGYQKLISGELGMYRGVRFADNPLAKLWNVGTTARQTAIKAALVPGSGAPDPATVKVEGTKMVGQPGATHTVTVASTTGFAPGQRVSIHLLRHDSGSLAAYGNKGVLNGPIFDDPMKQDVEIYSVPDSTHLVLKEPYMMTGALGKGLETDLGSTVFGYVTLGQTIHTATFLTPGMSDNAIIAGVAQPPVFYQPPAIDDYLSIFRITYDMWLKFQLWDARAYNVAFLTGANSTIQNRFFR